MRPGLGLGLALRLRVAAAPAGPRGVLGVCSAAMRGTLVVLVSALLSASALGCDSKASASDPQSAALRAEQRSKEYESCGASLHCAEGLRCFEHECRRSARSTVGDYYAATGAAARAKGDHTAAIAAYASALAQYDAEKIGLPPDVDCAYGGALAAAKAKKEHAELGARVLHRCVLAVTAGSPLRAKAIAELATLTDAGLDPLLLGAQKTADLYLTKAPARPATEKLVVTITATPQPAKSMALISEALGTPDLKRALISCWEQYNTASKKLALAAAVSFKSAYIPPEYDDEYGRYILKFDPPVALPPGPEATADACVRQIVEPALGPLKIRESFTTRLAVTIK